MRSVLAFSIPNPLDRIRKRFSSLKESGSKGFHKLVEIGGQIGNVFHNIAEGISNVLGGIVGLAAMTLKVAVAGLGLALIVFLRNFANSFGKPGTPSWNFSNASFGRLGLQLLGYIASDIFGYVFLGGLITITSYVFLVLGLYLSLKSGGLGR